MKVLLIEDSARLQTAVGTGLRKVGFAVDIAGDGEEGLWRAQSCDHDVVVLDLMLPKLDGLSLLRRLRSGCGGPPVLILTARDAVAERVQGLDAGADDYLVKPFAFDELLARVKALCRRRYGERRPVLAIADLQVDLARRAAARAGVPLDLTPREFTLLELLALRAGEVVSRADIERSLYDEQVEPMSNVVDATVCRLRRKVDARGVPLLHTKRGAGYLLGEES